MRHLLHATASIALAVGLANATPAFAQGLVQQAQASDQLQLPAPKAGRLRPLVVVVGENRGAETTDFIVPYAVLKDAGVADVRSLSTGPGPIQLTRGLKIAADQTLAQFDASAPDGADVVIIPAQASPKDSQLSAWIIAQAARGATVISVCEGARVAANAGLLKNRRAVTHWSAITGLAKAYPETTWIRDRRYVQDGPVISTTGVTASIPMTLALVEAIGGRGAAEATAKRLGASGWSAAHRSDDFVLSKDDIASAKRVIANRAIHETIEAPIEDGIDEVALALQVDAWGRSYQTTVVTTRPGRAPVVSRHGLTILPDAEPEPLRFKLAPSSAPAVQRFEQALDDMGERYGPVAVRLATLGMEYDAGSARADQ